MRYQLRFANQKALHALLTCSYFMQAVYVLFLTVHKEFIFKVTYFKQNFIPTDCKRKEGENLGENKIHL